MTKRFICRLLDAVVKNGKNGTRA